MIEIYTKYHQSSITLVCNCTSLISFLKKKKKNTIPVYGYYKELNPLDSCEKYVEISSEQSENDNFSQL